MHEHLDPDVQFEKGFEDGRRHERHCLLDELEGEMRYWDPRDAPRDLKDWIAEKRGTDD
jgi:hypothetical protein